MGADVAATATSSGDASQMTSQPSAPSKTPPPMPAAISVQSRGLAEAAISATGSVFGTLVLSTGGADEATTAAAVEALSRGGSAGGAAARAIAVVGVAFAGTDFAEMGFAEMGLAAGAGSDATFGELQPGGGTTCTML